MIYGIIILVAIIVIILLSKYLKNKYLKLTERDFSEYEEEKRKIQEEYRLEKVHKLRYFGQRTVL